VAASRVKTYDIVFMDMYMPVKNGLRASRDKDIRRESSEHNFPFIVEVISIDSTATRQQCHNSGMGKVLCKSLSWQSFLQCIATAGICTTSTSAPSYIVKTHNLDAHGFRCPCRVADTIGRSCTSGQQQPAFAVLTLLYCHPHLRSAHCSPRREDPSRQGRRAVAHPFAHRRTRDLDSQ
jgi:CheY-like chemotaxis protein